MQIKTERNGKTFPRLLTRGHVHLDGIDLDCPARHLWSERTARPSLSLVAQGSPSPAAPTQPPPAPPRGPSPPNTLPQPAHLKRGWQSDLHREHAGPQAVPQKEASLPPQTMASLSPSPQAPPRSLLTRRRSGCPAGSPADTGMQAASRRSPERHTFTRDLAWHLKNPLQHLH